MKIHANKVIKTLAIFCSTFSNQVTLDVQCAEPCACGDATPELFSRPYFLFNQSKQRHPIRVGALTKLFR